MTKVGIVCEYNPLHNGHVHHFQEVKKQSDADLIVLSLSSSFTQRGDLAIIDKFTRTELALEMGVDLIIECPTIFCMNEAKTFAYYHVRNLSLAGCDEIWIGSESNNPDLYKEYHNLINTNEFKVALNDYLSDGYSLKIAFYKSLESFNLSPLPSNDLLGLFYYEAILEINPNIKLKTIQRINARYDEESRVLGNIQSATYIRDNLTEFKKYVPDFSHNLTYLNADKLFKYIKYAILTNNNLHLLNEANEGIENRLKDVYKLYSYNELVSYLSTKRYSQTKIKRLLANVVLNMTKTDLVNAQKDSPYIRVLGFNNAGKSLLSELKKDVTIYTNIKEGINNSLDFEMKVSKILSSIYKFDLISNEQEGPKRKM